MRVIRSGNGHLLSLDRSQERIALRSRSWRYPQHLGRFLGRLGAHAPAHLVPIVI